MKEIKFHQKVAKLRFAERIEELEVGRVVELCRGKHDIKSVLDIGTGRGLFAQAFANRGLVVTGIDNDIEMILAARHHCPQVFFQLASGQAIPFASDSFDLAFMGMVLHEVADPLKTLSESRRISRLAVAVLEWPYKRQPDTPLKAHRLKADEIRQLSVQASFDYKSS